MNYLQSDFCRCCAKTLLGKNKTYCETFRRDLIIVNKNNGKNTKKNKKKNKIMKRWDI